MANKNAVRLGGAYVEITANNSKLVQGLKESESQLKSFTSELQSASATMTAFGAGIVVPLKKATDYFGEFEKQMLITKVVSRASEKELEQMTRQAKELGATTSWTARQVAEGMASLGRMGFDDREIRRTIASVMDLGRALDVDVNTAAKELGSVMRQFGAKTYEAGHYADVLAKATNSASMEMSELYDTMKYVGSVGNAIGMDVESVLALVAALRDAGATASQAGTQLRSIFLKFQTPKNVQIFADKFGVDIKDANGRLKSFVDIAIEAQHRARALGDDISSVARKMFGTLQAPGYINLLKATRLEEFRDELYACDGAARDFRETMESGVFGATQIGVSAVEAITNQLGEGLAPTVKEVRDILIAMSVVVRKFMDEHRPLISLIAKTGLAFGTLGPALLSVVGVFKTSTMFMRLLGTASNKLVGAWRSTSSEARALKKETARLNAEMARLKTQESALSSASAPFNAIETAAETAAISVANLNAQLAQASGAVASVGRVSKALFHKYNEGDVSINSTSYLVGGGERQRYNYDKTKVDERTVMVNGRSFKEDRAAAGEEFKERETNKIRAAEEELRARNERVKQNLLDEEQSRATAQRAVHNQIHYEEAQRISAGKERAVSEIDRQFMVATDQAYAEKQRVETRLDEFYTDKSRTATDIDRWQQEQIAVEKKRIAAEEARIKAIQESTKAEGFTKKQLKSAISAANDAYKKETQKPTETLRSILSERKAMVTEANREYNTQTRATVRSTAKAAYKTLPNEKVDPIIALTEQYLAGDKEASSGFNSLLRRTFNAGGMKEQRGSVRRYIAEYKKAKANLDKAKQEAASKAAAKEADVMSQWDKGKIAELSERIQTMQFALDSIDMSPAQEKELRNQIHDLESQYERAMRGFNPEAHREPAAVLKAQDAVAEKKAALERKLQSYKEYKKSPEYKQSVEQTRNNYLSEMKKLSEERARKLKDADTLREGEYASSNTVMVNAQAKRDATIKAATDKYNASVAHRNTIISTNEELKKAQANSKARIEAINSEATRLHNINSEDAKRGITRRENAIKRTGNNITSLGKLEQLSKDSVTSVYDAQEKANDARLKENLARVDQGSKAAVTQITQNAKEAQATLHATANGLISNVNDTVKAQSEAVARESTSISLHGGVGKTTDHYTVQTGGQISQSGKVDSSGYINQKGANISFAGMSAGEKASFLRSTAVAGNGALASRFVTDSKGNFKAVPTNPLPTPSEMKELASRRSALRSRVEGYMYKFLPQGMNIDQQGAKTAALRNMNAHQRGIFKEIHGEAKNADLAYKKAIQAYSGSSLKSELPRMNRPTLRAVDRTPVTNANKEWLDLRKRVERARELIARTKADIGNKHLNRRIRKQLYNALNQEIMPRYKDLVKEEQAASTKRTNAMAEYKTQKASAWSDYTKQVEKYNNYTRQNAAIRTHNASVRRAAAKRFNAGYVTHDESMAGSRLGDTRLTPNNGFATGTSPRDISQGLASGGMFTVSQATAQSSLGGQNISVAGGNASSTHAFTSSQRMITVAGKEYITETNNATAATNKLSSAVERTGKSAKIASGAMHALSFAAKGLGAVAKFFGGMVVTLAAWQAVMVVFEKIASFAKETAENMEKASKSNDELINKDVEATDKVYSNIETDEQKIDQLVSMASSTEPVTAQEKKKLDALYNDLAKRGIINIKDVAGNGLANAIVPDENSPTGYRVTSAGSAEFMKARALDLQLPELQRQESASKFDVFELDPSKFDKFTEIGADDAAKYLEQYKGMYEVLSSLTPKQRDALFGKNSWWTGRFQPFGSKSLFEKVAWDRTKAPQLAKEALGAVKEAGPLSKENEDNLRSLLRHALTFNEEDYMRHAGGFVESNWGGIGFSFLQALNRDQGQGFIDTYKKLQEFGASSRAIEDVKSSRDALIKDAKEKSSEKYVPENAEAKAEAKEAAEQSAVNAVDEAFAKFKKKIEAAELTPAQRQLQELEEIVGDNPQAPLPEGYEELKKELGKKAREEVDEYADRENKRLNDESNKEAAEQFATVLKQVRGGKLDAQGFIDQYNAFMKNIPAGRDMTEFYSAALSQMQSLVSATKATISSTVSSNAYEFADLSADVVLDVQRQQLDQLRTIGAQARMIYSWMINQDEYKDVL